MATLSTPAAADPPKSPKLVTVGRGLRPDRGACAGARPAARVPRPADLEGKPLRSEIRPQPRGGIAQFMPGTAARRGLADPYDIDHVNSGLGALSRRAARPSSAIFVSPRRPTMPARTASRRWLSRGGLLPLETENYVLDVMGEPVDAFADAAYAGTVGRRSTRRRASAPPAATFPSSRRRRRCPWRASPPSRGASGFRQLPPRRRGDQAVAAARGALPAMLSGVEPVVSRVRSPLGRSGIHAVRIGADSREEAEKASCARPAARVS